MKPPKLRTPPDQPPVENHDRMTQAAFHRRYLDAPEGVKMELVGGVVNMPSPTRGPHGLFHSQLNGLLFLYAAATPGVEVADNITTILGEESEPQPDLLLRLLPECGGQSRYNAEAYLEGAPELVVEVAHGSAAIDLHAKRDDYLAAGVQEYIVLVVAPPEIHWFHFPSRRRLRPNKAGVWKSRVFPGLWLDGPGLLARDGARLIAAIQNGLATEEYAAFVRQLQARRPPQTP